MLDQSPIGNRRALSAPTDAATRNLQLSGADAVVTGYGPSYTPYVPYAGSIGRDSSSYFYESGTPFSTSDASVSPKSARRSFMAPASRGKHLPLLHPSVALRSSKPRSKLWTAGIIVGSLVVIAGLVVVCATVADKSSGTTPLSGAPGNIIGVGGYTVRTAEYVRNVCLRVCPWCSGKCVIVRSFTSIHLHRLRTQPQQSFGTKRFAPLRCAAVEMHPPTILPDCPTETW